MVTVVAWKFNVQLNGFVLAECRYHTCIAFRDNESIDFSVWFCECVSSPACVCAFEFLNQIFTIKNSLQTHNFILLSNYFNGFCSPRSLVCCCCCWWWWSARTVRLIHWVEQNSISVGCNNNNNEFQNAQDHDIFAIHNYWMRVCVLCCTAHTSYTYSLCLRVLARWRPRNNCCVVSVVIAAILRYFYFRCFNS